MAIEPHLARGPRLSAIPIPQQSRAVIDGAGAVVDALGQASERRDQTQQRVDALNRQAAEYAQEERRAMQANQGIVRMEAGRNAIERRREELRNAPGGLSSYREDAAKAWSEWSSEFLSALPPDEKVRQQFTAPLARMGALFERDDDAWLREQHAKLDGEALGSLADNDARAALANPLDADGVGSRRQSFAEFLDHKPMPPAARVAALSAYDKSVRSGVIDGLENAGETGAMRKLAGDATFMSVFDKDYADAVLDRAGVADRAAALAAAAQAKAQQDAAKEEIDTLDALIETGAVVPQKRIDAAVATAREAGVDGDVLVKFSGRVATQAVNRQFGPAADPDGSRTRAEIARLNGVRAQREFSSEENMLYERLIAIQGSKRQSDAETLKPLAGKSAGGDLAVLAAIDKKPDADRFALAEEVRPGMGYFQLLSPQARAAAMEGQFDLKANPDLIKGSGPVKGADPTRGAFRAHLGAMAGEMNEAAIEGYRSVADSIYVKMQKDRGQSGWDPALYAYAANIATGAHRGSDGKYRGGIGLVNNHHVWLPDWASADSVAQGFARADYANATYDGERPVAKADLLANFTPVLVDGGRAGEPAHYIFVNSANGETVKRKGTKQPYIGILSHRGFR